MAKKKNRNKKNKHNNYSYVKKENAAQKPSKKSSGKYLLCMIGTWVLLTLGIIFATVGHGSMRPYSLLAIFGAMIFAIAGAIIRYREKGNSQK